jgi:hypothetical protein
MSRWGADLVILHANKDKDDSVAASTSRLNVNVFESNLEHVSLWDKKPRRAGPEVGAWMLGLRCREVS